MTNIQINMCHANRTGMCEVCGIMVPIDEETGQPYCLALETEINHLDALAEGDEYEDD